MLRCPKCGSTSIKKSSAAYEQGKFRREDKSGGIGVSSSGRLYAYKGCSSSETISTVAQKNAPPNIDASVIGCVGVAAIPTGMLIGYLADGIWGMLVAGFLLIIGSPIAFVIFMFLYKPSEAQKSADTCYAGQWYCKKCGDIFSAGNHGV